MFPCFSPGPALMRRPLPFVLAAALLASSGFASVWAEPAAGTSDDWRAANQLVGQFPRGHADIVHWEAQQPAAAAAPDPAVVAGTRPWSLADALRTAQRSRPELLLRPGLNALERAELERKQAELKLQVERAWIQALSARRVAAVVEAELGAALAGAELAARLVRVGNWPAQQGLQQQLLAQQAQAQQRAARHQARAAEWELWRIAGAGLSLQQLVAHLPPDATPPGATPDPARLNAAALEAQALQAHPRWRALELQAQQAERALNAASQRQLAATLDAVFTPAPGEAGAALPGLAPQQRWPHAWDDAARARAQADALQRQIRADLHTALSAWQTAAALADAARQQHQLLMALQDETQQRYNGMLKSTFDLLASARARLQGEQAALLAQRDVELAQAELRAVLAGLPYSGSAPGGAPVAAGAAAPH